jgi:hypothetical protein
VGRLPDGRVVHLQVTAYRPDDDFTRVQADPDVEGNALGALNFPGITPH